MVLFPPRTTPHTWPWDARIIQCFNWVYRDELKTTNMKLVIETNPFSEITAGRTTELLIFFTKSVLEKYEY